VRPVATPRGAGMERRDSASPAAVNSDNLIILSISANWLNAPHSPERFPIYLLDHQQEIAVTVPKLVKQLGAYSGKIGLKKAA